MIKVKQGNWLHKSPAVWKVIQKWFANYENHTYRHFFFVGILLSNAVTFRLDLSVQVLLGLFLTS